MPPPLSLSLSHLPPLSLEVFLSFLSFELVGLFYDIGISWLLTFFKFLVLGTGLLEVLVVGS